MKSALQLYYARKSFGRKKVLENVCFNLRQGEILGVYGRNGSGKSSLLKILFGTLKSDAIDVRINDIPFVPKASIPERHIAYLPQDPFLPKHLKVRQVIPLFYEDGDEQDRIFRARYVEKMAAQKVGTLSLGERRYLELLLIAHLEHPFLLLDEPFSMIEPLYKEEIKKVLFSLKAKKGILLTDHYYQDVLDIADKNAVLTKGELHAVNTKEDLQKLGYLR